MTGCSLRRLQELAGTDELLLPHRATAVATLPTIHHRTTRAGADHGERRHRSHHRVPKPKQPYFYGPEREAVIIDLAKQELTHAQIAGKYSRALQTIRNFASANREEIENSAIL
jgi:hypothetical protein